MDDIREAYLQAVDVDYSYRLAKKMETFKTNPVLGYRTAGSQAEIETMRQAFEQRRNYIVERMNAIPGVSCIQPEGAFYVMMNLEQLLGKTIHGVEITNDDVFADAFLKYGLVAVVPGSGFGAPNFVRWSYATSMENIKEGLDRLEKFLAE